MTSLRRSDEGVSPVVGTLLVVAITIVLAGAVFLVVVGVNEKTEKAPSISFAKDGPDRTIQVVKVDPGVDWRDFEFRGTCDPLLNDGPFPTEEGRTVLPGDTLVCEPGETLVIIASKPNQKIYETTFP